MRRLYPHLPICCVVLLLVFGHADWPRAVGRQPSEPIVGRKPADVARVLGVSSCASMACHNGNGPPGTKGSEYSTWIAVDPHAQAYETLLKPESERMHQNLAQFDTERKNYARYRSASENPLCLQCHAMGAGLPHHIQADGVGCERCHGPAEHWKSTHYLNGFDRTTPGFVDTRKLVTRAQTCMKCHVGDADQEVNHDLIAAGHPRLRFEYGAYYANYPRHWADTGEKRADPGFEARSWAVGQLLSAKAALELLASRTKGTDPVTGEKKPWPEFAEYECAACHHGLTKPSFRQERDLARTKEGKKVHAGELTWGTWYLTLLPILADRLPGGNAKQLDQLRLELQRDLAKRVPPQAEVAEKATRAARLIEDWVCAVNYPLNKNQTLALIGALSKQEGIVAGGWDGGTQVYLGLAAVHNALTDLDPAFRTQSPIRVPLLDMRKTLREAFRDANPLYDTPKYDPEPMKKDLAKIRDLLK